MYKHLTQYELYYIWQTLGYKLGGDVSFGISLTVPQVANKLGKHRATIYRALKFISKSDWRYPCRVDNIKFRTRNKDKFKQFTPKIRSYLQDKLEEGWSPEVISGRLLKCNKRKISFKTIYSYIAQDKLDGGNLYKKLPHHGKRYKYSSGKRIAISNRVDISQRPAVVEAKTRLGDLEGDTIVGCKGGSKDCLLTLVDRASKLTLIRKIPNKTAAAVERAMNDCYDNSIIPFVTVTYDNGTEFSNHQNISNTLNCSVFFARPYRSCDRGLNEHTNGLIRFFFPKKTDFGQVTDQQVQHVENLLNNRPRKSLGFLTPNEVVNKRLRKTYKKFVAP